MNEDGLFEVLLALRLEKQRRVSDGFIKAFLEELERRSSARNWARVTFQPWKPIDDYIGG